MRVLPTGANGHIGMRLLPLLLEAGHEVHCLVRSRERAGRAFRDYPGTTGARQLFYLEGWAKRAPSRATSAHAAGSKRYCANGACP